MLYVGVDAHKSTSQITVLNEAGVILRRKRQYLQRKAAQLGFQVVALAETR
jgi:hypothetical protein